MNDRAHNILKRHNRWNADGYGIRRQKISYLEDLVSEDRRDSVKNFKAALFATDDISNKSPNGQPSMISSTALNGPTGEKEPAAASSIIVSLNVDLPFLQVKPTMYLSKQMMLPPRLLLFPKLPMLLEL